MKQYCPSVLESNHQILESTINMFFLNSFLDIPLFTFPLTPDSVTRHIQGPSKTMPKRTSDAMSPNRRYEIWDPDWREIIVSGTAAITTFSSSWPSFSCSCVSNLKVNSYVTLSFIIVIKSNDYRTFFAIHKVVRNIFRIGYCDTISSNTTCIT